MAATGSSLVGHDFMEMLVPTIPHIAFFATPENKWGTLIQPHLPTWLPILISWALKVSILRYWGLKGYRAAIPLFVGLVLGEFAVGGSWSFVRGIIGVETYTFFY